MLIWIHGYCHWNIFSHNIGWNRRVFVFKLSVWRQLCWSACLFQVFFFFLMGGLEQWLRLIIQELRVPWHLQLKANKIWFSNHSALPKLHTLCYNPAAKTALIKCLDFSFHTFLARKTSLFLHKYPLQQSWECNRWARRLIWLLLQVQNGFTRFFCLANLICTLKCDGQRPWVSVCAFLVLTTIKMKNPAFHMSLNLLVNENCCFILWFHAEGKKKTVQSPKQVHHSQ